MEKKNTVFNQFEYLPNLFLDFQNESTNDHSGKDTLV